MKSLATIYVLSILLTISFVGKSQDYTDKLRQVDKFLSSKYNAKTPGCAIGIVKDGQLIYSKGFGLSNMNYDISWSPESVINIMSVSKQFTAACIALLLLENKISLSDDVRTYMPELPDYGYKITIDHLIRHTSGIRDYADLVTLCGGSAENVANRSDALKLVIQQKELNFIPGDRYSYSNSGYLLLTYIVERSSEMSFPDFAKSKIFDPLQMSHSFFSDDPHRIIGNGVTSYGIREDGSYFQYNLGDNRMGCAGLYSTVEDLYKWDQNFYHGKVGGEPFNKLMLSLGKFNDGSENDYAFGNIIDRHEGFKEINHSGGLLGIRCKVSRFPAAKLTIIYLGNGSQNQNEDVYPIASLFLINSEILIRENVNSLSTPVTPIQLDLIEMEAKTGLYYVEDRKITFRIVTTETKELNYEIIGSGNGGELFPLSKTDFRLSNGNTLKFHSNENNVFELVSKTGKKSIGKRIDIVEKENVGVYTGRYYSDELNSIFDIGSVNESIVFKCGERIVKSPIKKDDNTVTFFESRLGQVTIEFRIGTDGRIEFLLLTTERTNKLKFKRV